MSTGAVNAELELWVESVNGVGVVPDGLGRLLILVKINGLAYGKDKMVKSSRAVYM